MQVDEMEVKSLVNLEEREENLAGRNMVGCNKLKVDRNIN